MVKSTMGTSFFLFCDSLTLERLDWLYIFCKNHIFQEKTSFYLTGDALYSLFTPNLFHGWEKICDLNPKQIKIVPDKHECQILGLNLDYCSKKLKESLVLKNSTHIQTNMGKFWDSFMKKLKIETNSVANDSIGFFQMEGPYFARTSFYCVQFLKASIRNNLIPSCYAYLDGLHLFHNNQSPSEFENIGQNLAKLFTNTSWDSSSSQLYGCSRCATARGYCTTDDEGNIIPISTIDNAKIVNLNLIVEQFLQQNPIFSPNSGLISQHPLIQDQKQRMNKEQIPSLLIFITHSPYQTEWVFGGLSFAMACANHDIPTKVVFVEDGVYTLYGLQNPTDQDRVFNIQEIIEATGDMEFLDYFSYFPRGKLDHPLWMGFENGIIHNLNEMEFSSLLDHQSTLPSANLMRIFFF